MAASRRVLLPVLWFALGCFCVVLSARAEDEDTSANVYLVFDPETGDFVTVDDPNKRLPNQTGVHDPSAQTGHPPAQANGSGSQVAGSPGDAAATATQGSGDGPGSGNNAAVLAGAAVVGILIVGGLLYRKRQAASPRNT